jgi:hypothetical protein
MWGTVEPDGFALPHILLTAVIAAVGAYGLLRLLARALRERDDIGVAVSVGIATLLLRHFGNVPVLNDDLFSVVSPNDLLGFPAALLAALGYWVVWPLGGDRPPFGQAARWGVLLGLLGFVVNVVVI